LEIVGYVTLVLVGISLGLIGGGGAILTVPILVYLFKTPVIDATSYSLFIVGLASLFGVWRYFQKRLVSHRVALGFLWPSFIGTYLARRVVTPWIPENILIGDYFSLSKDRLIMGAFALVMLGASFAMIRAPEGASLKKVGSPLIFFVMALAVGFTAGFVGAGGGFLIIPALVLLAGMPMQNAVGTSLLIISVNSLFGFSGDVIAGKSIDWIFLLLATAFAFAGVFIGTLLSKYVSGAKLKQAFGWFVLVMGLFVLGGQLL
jgi:uncharacterized membrane protein YfcA